MLKLEYKDYQLDFKFEAGTSRGVLTHHQIVLLKIWDDKNPEIFGLGEAAPLVNLSVDKLSDVKLALPEIAEKIQLMPVPVDQIAVFEMVKELVDVNLPSLRMALETAFLDLINGGKRLIFENDFVKGEKSIPINGLIWMGDEEFMKSQIHQKLDQKFECIKMKIGAIDFEKELALLKMLREASPDLILRVDANGAFPTNEVLFKLNQLAKYNLHSIEQPISANQPEAMQLICRRTPVPVALDEELIGITAYEEKKELLEFIKPQYIILKPTLLGGFAATLEWIEIAEKLKIGWWLTSALESNVSLSAIAQFAGNYKNPGYQGLGTGQLYHNNFECPLELDGPHLKYNRDKEWASVF